MADKEDNESETRLCTNCKRQIASSNFVMHELHCGRHIVLCEYCDSPVPRAEIQEHFDELHAKVPCPICTEDMPKDQVEAHKTVCPKKPVQCPYCELDLPGDELLSHQEFCGTRTEPCPLCLQYIMLKDSTQHELSNCTYPAPKPTPPTSNVQNQLFSSDDHFTFTNTPFQFDSLSNALRADSVSVPRYDAIHADIVSVPRHGAVQADSAGVPRRGVLNRINNTHSRATKPNTHVRVMKPVLPSGLSKKSPLSKVNIAKPSNVGAATANAWEKNSNREQDRKNVDVRAPAGIQPEENVALPCEFCGEMYPLDVLIIHQSGCDPVAAHAPQSYRAVQETEGYDIGPDEDFMTSDTSNNHYRLSSSDRPIPVMDNLGHAEDKDTYEVSGDVFPCEFCSDLFPESYLFQHQAICDANRTTTPAPASFRLRNRSEIMQETSPDSPPYSFNAGDYDLIDDEEMGYDVPDTWSRHNQGKRNDGKVSNIDRHEADNPESATSYTSKYGSSSLYTPNLFKKPNKETTVTNRDMVPNGARATQVRTNRDIGQIGRKATKPKSNVDVATNGSRTQKSRNTGDVAPLPRVQKATPIRTVPHSGASGAAGRPHAVSRRDLYSKGELPDTNNARKASKEDVNFVLRGDHSNYGKQATATNINSSQIRSRGGAVESGQSESSRTSPTRTRRQMARLADEEETYPMMAHNLYSDPSHQTTRTATNIANHTLDTDNPGRRGRSNRRTFDPK